MQKGIHSTSTLLPIQTCSNLIEKVYTFLDFSYRLHYTYKTLRFRLLNYNYVNQEMGN